MQEVKFAVDAINNNLLEVVHLRDITVKPENGEDNIFNTIHINLYMDGSGDVIQCVTNEEYDYLVALPTKGLDVVIGDDRINGYSYKTYAEQVKKKNSKSGAGLTTHHCESQDALNNLVKVLNPIAKSMVTQDLEFK